MDTNTWIRCAVRLPTNTTDEPMYIALASGDRVQGFLYKLSPGVTMPVGDPIRYDFDQWIAIPALGKDAGK